MPDLYTILDKLNIGYQKFDHPAVHTVAEAEHLAADIPGEHCKALFLRDSKHDQFYLVLAQANKKLEMKKIQRELGVQKLTFASSEELETYLHIAPGSVSPFCLINETSGTVTVILDRELLNADKVGFHPNVNTATLLVSPDDLKKFITATGHELLVLQIN